MQNEKVDDYMMPMAQRGEFSGTVLLAQNDKVILNRGQANLEDGVPNAPETGVRSVKNIVYQEARGWDKSLNTLDIYYQDGIRFPNLRPVIVWVHGGGWSAGDKSNLLNTLIYESIPEYCVKQGYVLIVLNFRLALNPRSPNTKISDMALDIGSALKWLSKNVRHYGGKGKEFILWGYSSGAHLVSLVSTDPRYLRKNRLSLNDLKGVIAMDVPEYDVPMALKLLRDGKVGFNEEETEKRLRSLYRLFGETESEQMELSPVHFLDHNARFKPFLLISAGLMVRKPQSLTYQMAVHFKNQLLKKGVDVSHYHFQNYNHTDLMSKFMDGEVSTVIKKYLDRVSAYISRSQKNGFFPVPSQSNLITALKGNAVMRERARGTLGQIGDAPAVEPLITALKDSNLRLRETAAEVLAQIGAPARKRDQV